MHGFRNYSIETGGRRNGERPVHQEEAREIQGECDQLISLYLCSDPQAHALILYHILDPLIWSIG